LENDLKIFLRGVFSKENRIRKGGNIMNQAKDKQKITLSEQLKKFAIKSMIGFHTVLMYGIGRQVGIFDYLYKKSKSQPVNSKVTSISFTLEELSNELNLDLKYLDAWLHMAIECGLFEIDESAERTAKTAPYVYDLFIDHTSMVYLGGTTFGFYESLTFLETILKNFKTGKLNDNLVNSMYKEGQEMSAVLGRMVEGLFSKYYKEDKKSLKKGGTVLEIGCGYGLNLEHWARKYNKTKFVGIDISPKGIEHAKKLVEVNHWSNRVEILEVPLEDYVKSTITRFNLIILNQVLHEMNPDERFRISVLENIYILLKDNGILIVGENIMPSTFTKRENILYEVMHKWFEVWSRSRHYDEKSFELLVNSTSFKEHEFIRENRNYCWMLRK
jgi:SAM-dependent methyltransferase